MSRIVVFEDEGYKQLLPLTRVRPACDLLCGMLTLLEKIEAAYDMAVDLHARNYLAAVLKKKHKTALVNSLSGSSSVLFLNGRILASEGLEKTISLRGEDCLFVNTEGEIVAARVSKHSLEELRPKIPELLAPALFAELKGKVESKEIKVRLIKYPWELIQANAEEIEKDFKVQSKKLKLTGKIEPSTMVYNKKNVFVEEGAVVEALCVLDARQGPIYIGKNAVVKSLSLIEGPVFIGEGTQVLSGQLRPGTSIGPHCKVGGEVAASIILGYTNKAHYGFLGHSYVCEWVNLGAGTTNSDLKNTYGNIKMWNNGTEIETGQQFLGCLIGDHVKTAIGTMINTGTVIDMAVNVFGVCPTPKYLPPFRWGPDQAYAVEKVFAVAKAIAKRRNVIFDETEQALFGTLAKEV